MRSLLTLLLLLSTIAHIQAQSGGSSTEKLKKWLPDNITGYVTDAETYAAELKRGDEPYYICAKKYNKGESSISIVVLDYINHTQSIQAKLASWVEGKKEENSAGSTFHTIIAGVKADEITDKTKNSTQLTLYYGNRYQITLSATTESSAFLKGVAENLQFSKLPN